MSQVDLKKMYEWRDPRAIHIEQTRPNYTINFHKDGKDIGKLDFNSGEVKFEGDFEASAVQFVEHLSSKWTSRLDAERAVAARLLAELVTFELSEEVELDDAYRKGFNDAMQTCRAVFISKAKEMEK